MNIVAMGGGTGLSSLLQGLKTYVRDDWNANGSALTANRGANRPNLRVKDLSAVVTVSDDGGSSGRLRRAFNVLPPGDIRNCLVALSEDEALLSRLFQFRFGSGRGLKGHSFGNLFLTALTGIMGDFQDAIKVSGEVLATRGRIFPSTMSNVTLEGVLENGRIVRGETQISRSRQRIARVRLVPSHCRPLPETLQAIEEADAITMGPGSLFTSMIPNILVRGVAKQMARSRAARIFICNLMTQPGETISFTAADHLKAVYQHCGFPIFDYVLLNNRAVSAQLQKQYGRQTSRPVEADVSELEKLGVRVVRANLLSEERTASYGERKVRHHPGRLAEAVLNIAAAHEHRPASHERSRASASGITRKGAAASSS